MISMKYRDGLIRPRLSPRDREKCQRVSDIMAELGAMRPCATSLTEAADEARDAIREVLTLTDHNAAKPLPLFDRKDSDGQEPGSEAGPAEEKEEVRSPDLQDDEKPAFVVAEEQSGEAVHGEPPPRVAPVNRRRAASSKG